VTAFIDSVTETWIDFEYEGHAFSAHNPLNGFWLFVRDPACPEKLLREVEALLAWLRLTGGRAPRRPARQLSGFTYPTCGPALSYSPAS